MSLPDISTIIGSIINLTSSSGGTITIPGIQGTIGSQDYTFIRTIVQIFCRVRSCRSYFPAFSGKNSTFCR